MSGRPAYLLISLITLIISWSSAVCAKDLLRMEIKKDGVYYLTPADLQNAGIPANIDPGTIRIFNQGVEIPIYVHGEDIGVLHPSLYVEFDGSGIPRGSEYYEFTDTNIYCLEWGGERGKRVTLENGTPWGLQPPLSFINRLRLESDREWWWEKPDSGENDSWFWERIGAGEAKEYTNWFEVVYRDTYTADNDPLRFAGSGDGAVDFAISNFYDNRRSIAILDITGYPSEVIRFENMQTGGSLPYSIYFRDTLQPDLCLQILVAAPEICRPLWGCQLRLQGQLPVW